MGRAWRHSSGNQMETVDEHGSCENKTAEFWVELKRHWEAGFLWTQFLFFSRAEMSLELNFAHILCLKYPKKISGFIYTFWNEGCCQNWMSLEVCGAEQTFRHRWRSDPQLNLIVKTLSLFSSFRAQVEWMENYNMICICKVAIDRTHLSSFKEPPGRSLWV